MKRQIKKTRAVLLAVCFLMSVTAVAVTAAPSNGNDIISTFKEAAIKESAQPPISSYVFADFTGNPTDLCLGNNGKAYVKFTDKSTGHVTYRVWRFGDGTTSTEKNPTHGYTSGGSYTVSLTIGNELNKDTKTKYNYITVDSTCLH